ncbi:glutaredoxin family protein [Ideonella sp. A 288]|uniref:glutaredoxin family protein n=1 Tax=Ideonella sp. A 288 TaxID=1962181 RepID=UPI000B4B9EC4|nr:glutaredoxin family protein [Ideonella sp. A 288]
MESRRSILGLVALVLAISAASQWWGHRQEQALGRSVAQAARPGDIVMIASDTCIFCKSARRWMDEHGVAFSECSVERDAACAERYRALSSPGTPLMLVRGEPQLGFNPERVRQRLSAG